MLNGNSPLENSNEATGDRLKRRAAELGFQLVGICRAESPPGLDRFHAWLDAGYAGTMRYLENRRDAYAHPRHVLEGARSIVMLGLAYSPVPPAPTRAGTGRVARYAWGTRDYHDVVHERLASLAASLREIAPGANVRGVVDTAPLLEREFAQLAGLGWIGKNTLLLNRELGSYFFLAALLTDLELIADAAWTTDHCGSCRACLDACPTGAFPAPYVLDARRCISYLTIESPAAVPVELRASLGDLTFGCDICQEVCPWNRRAPETTEAEFLPTAELNPLDLVGLFALDEAEFRGRFRQTPLWRTKRRGLLRNAAIALGNQRSPEGLPALTLGLADAEPLVRASSAWALGRYASDSARQPLRERLAIETDETVRAEIVAALAMRS